MEDDCPDASKLEKEILEMEGFFTHVLGIDPGKIETWMWISLILFISFYFIFSLN